MNGDDTSRQYAAGPTAPIGPQPQEQAPYPQAEPVAPQAAPAQEEEAYGIEAPAEPEAEAQPLFDPVTWRAAEFVTHDKNFKWYLALGTIAVVASIVVYLLSKDIISSATLVLVAAMLAYIGSRKPREVEYHLDDKELSVGSRRYEMDRFKSFSLLREGSLHSAALLPFQRFKPIVTIYFNADDEDLVSGTLAQLLPLEERDHDLIDRMLHQIKL